MASRLGSRHFITAGALALALAAQPAAAQTAEQLQVDFERGITAQAELRMSNFRRGSTTPWSMERTVTGAEGAGRCTTRFLTPRLLSGTGVANPSSTYTLGWGTVSQVLIQDRNLIWRAAHMADAEWGQLTYPDAASARTARTRFVALARACGSQVAAVPVAQAQQPNECALQNTIPPERVIAACDALLAAGNFEQTVENRFKVYAFRSAAQGRRSNFAAALTDADEAVRINPALALGYVLRGFAANGLQRYPEAVASFEAALRIEAGEENALRGRASALIALKRYGDAALAAAELVRHHPNDAGANNLACWVDAAFLGRDLAAARRHCDAAIRLNPDEPSYLDSRGMVSLKQQRFEDAWRDYDQAVRKLPTYASGLFGRGIAALRLGRTAEGNADLAAARRLNPNVDATYAEAGIRP